MIFKNNHFEFLPNLLHCVHFIVKLRNTSTKKHRESNSYKRDTNACLHCSLMRYLSDTNKKVNAMNDCKVTIVIIKKNASTGKLFTVTN